MYFDHLQVLQMLQAIALLHLSHFPPEINILEHQLENYLLVYTKKIYSLII